MDTRCKIVLWLALLPFSVQLGVSQERVSKTLEERFSLTGAGKLEIDNKYGNIELTGWERDDVQIKVGITVTHHKKDNAENLLERIRPIFKSGKGFVSISTEISRKRSNWIVNLLNGPEAKDIDLGQVQINYSIFLPKNAGLKITNRFGNVVIQEWNGELNTLMEHGDLWLGKDVDKAKIYHKFGRIKAQSIKQGELYLKNGELEMRDSETLQLNSEGSEINLQVMDTLQIYSVNDDITLAEVAMINGGLKFGSLRLNTLSKTLNIALKVSDLRLNRIIGHGSSLLIEQESSNLELNVTDFPHHFEAIMEGGIVQLPSSFEKVDSQILDKKKVIRKISADYGNQGKGYIQIKGTKGILKILE
ncbi:MAG: hypothetical protein AAGB24_15655 [Bacteroidota bacterium]